MKCILSESCQSRHHNHGSRHIAESGKSAADELPGAHVNGDVPGLRDERGRTPIVNRIYDVTHTPCLGFRVCDRDPGLTRHCLVRIK